MEYHLWNLFSILLLGKSFSLIFEELIFVEKMLSEEFGQQNMRKLEHTQSV